MSVVVSHPTGNPNVRAALRALAQGGRLDRFHTALALPNTGWGLCLNPQLERRLGQRCFPEVPWSRIRLHPARELVRHVAQRYGPAALVRHEKGWASVDGVYTALDRAVAAGLLREAQPTRGIYAYEDGALESFRAAEARGITRFYDLPSVYWKSRLKLFAEEAERVPDWSLTLNAIKDSSEKTEKKDREILSADHIIVASNFNRKAIKDYFGDDLKVTVLPYGCPPVLVDRISQRDPKAPLRLLFAGGMTQQKGMADLIAALGRVSIDWRITIAGQRPAASPQALTDFLQDPRCTWLGTVPHQTLLEHMVNAHVFVFPSLSEGFGLVITEALAAGLPVITTHHTGGVDILSEGQDGFIVPIRDPDAIAERITRFAEDEQLRQQMATHALGKAMRSGWSHYETGILRLIRDNIGE